MRTTETVLHLESCPGCGGKGSLGSCGIYVIGCERCEGKGLAWIERCALTEERS